MKTILGTMTFGNQVDRAGAHSMIDYFRATGGCELDTAYQYCDGKTELMLGDLIDSDSRGTLQIATKVNPWNDYGLKPDEINRQFSESLSRLGADHVDLLYLHGPDHTNPVTDSLSACQDLFQKGKFREFGLSNFASWQVAEIVELCRKNEWMAPTVYQGLYNALNRDVEPELFPCLRNYGIRFYAYNPLAGGFLTGKHRNIGDMPGKGRFADNKEYQARYWKADYFTALDAFSSACSQNNVSPAQAAIGWLANCSKLSSEHGDGIIIGASSLDHLKENLVASGTAEVPSSVVDALDRGWEVVKPNCFRYFR